MPDRQPSIEAGSHWRHRRTGAECIILSLGSIGHGSRPDRVRWRNLQSGNRDAAHPHWFIERYEPVPATPEDTHE